MIFYMTPSEKQANKMSSETKKIPVETHILVR